MMRPFNTVFFMIGRGRLKVIDSWTLRSPAWTVATYIRIASSGAQRHHRNMSNNHAQIIDWDWTVHRISAERLERYIAPPPPYPP